MQRWRLQRQSEPGQRSQRSAPVEHRVRTPGTKAFQRYLNLRLDCRSMVQEDTMLDAVMELFGTDSDRDRRIAELNLLGDHELADLGLVRDQIEAFVDTQLDV